MYSFDFVCEKQSSLLEWMLWSLNLVNWYLKFVPDDLQLSLAELEVQIIIRKKEKNDHLHF